MVAASLGPRDEELVSTGRPSETDKLSQGVKGTMFSNAMFVQGCGRTHPSSMWD